MKARTITLILPKQTTEEEIKAIRAKYKQDDYRVNIVVSGNAPFIDTMQEFLKASKN